MSGKKGKQRPRRFFTPEFKADTVEGAKATANSCRWYAMDLRRKKVEVPDRVKPKKPEAPESETPVAETGDAGDA
jgi:hypothetical protein